MSDSTCTPRDQRQVLAAGPVATVESCSCGTVHVHVGPLTLRFTESSLLQLQRTLTDACCRRLGATDRSAEALALRYATTSTTRGLA